MNTAMNQLLLCMTQQANTVRAFIQTLEDEADELLESVPNNVLTDITDRKGGYAAQLAGLDQRRAELLDTLGFTPDQAGIEAACRAYPQLRGPSEELFTLAHQAGELNRHNGQIINTFLAHNQRALATLRSLMGEDLYDAKGRPS